MIPLLFAKVFSNAQQKWPNLARRLSSPAFVWTWTYRAPLLKALFSTVVIAWSLPSAYRAALSPDFLKTLLLVLLFALFVLRKSLRMNPRDIPSTTESTQ